MTFMISKKNYPSFLLCLTSTIFFSCLILLSNVESNEWGPWGKDSIYEVEVNKQPSHEQTSNLVSQTATFPIKLLITFFQKVISPVDGATCDFYPTCSAYAKQALKKHGLFLGLVMASERVIRDHSPEGYDLIYKFDRYYVYDPVENNDFWFNKRMNGSR